MNFHLPKPLHGWREFIGEVGIIVFGILIALGAEQMVERYDWHQRAKNADWQIQAEIYQNAVQFAERIAVQPCLRTHIAALRSQLNSSDDHWRGMPIVASTPQANYRARVLDGAYAAPNRAWVADRWDAAKSDGVISHMPADRVMNYELDYDSIGIMDRLEETEQENASKLAYLATDRNLTHADRINSLAALAEVDRVNSIMAIVSVQFLTDLQNLSLPYAREPDVKANLADLDKYQRSFWGRATCLKPLTLHVQ
jgi:hypothetical protein